MIKPMKRKSLVGPPERGFLIGVPLIRADELCERSIGLSRLAARFPDDGEATQPQNRVGLACDLGESGVVLALRQQRETEMMVCPALRRI
jgi:hypothetical protein